MGSRLACTIMVYTSGYGLQEKNAKKGEKKPPKSTFRMLVGKNLTWRGEGLGLASWPKLYLKSYITVIRPKVPTGGSAPDELGWL